MITHDDDDEPMDAFETSEKPAPSIVERVHFTVSAAQVKTLMKLWQGCMRYEQADFAYVKEKSSTPISAGLVTRLGYQTLFFYPCGKNETNKTSSVGLNLLTTDATFAATHTFLSVLASDYGLGTSELVELEDNSVCLVGCELAQFLETYADRSAGYFVCPLYVHEIVRDESGTTSTRVFALCFNVCDINGTTRSKIFLTVGQANSSDAATYGSSDTAQAHLELQPREYSLLATRYKQAHALSDQQGRDLVEDFLHTHLLNVQAPHELLKPPTQSPTLTGDWGRADFIVTSHEITPQGINLKLLSVHGFTIKVAIVSEANTQLLPANNNAVAVS